MDFGVPGSSGGGTNSGGGSLLPTPGGTNDYSGPPGTNGVPGTGFYRVVRDGVHMWGITNGMVLSNVLETVVEFAVDSTDQVVGVSFYDTNNIPLIGASAQSIGSNVWVLIWNTTMVFNGDYAIHAELNFASDEPVVSQPVTVTINNIISFPNYFSTVFGDEMWIYAQTIPNAAYEIDLYDESTNYLGSFDDYADGNGTISFIWDLTDGSGDTFDSTNFFGVFTVDTSSLPNAILQPNLRSQASAKPSGTDGFLTTQPNKKVISFKTKAKNGGVVVHPNTGGSSASAPQLWSKEGKWTPNNNWVVAYGSLTGDATVDQRATAMIVGGSASPTDYNGILGTLDAYGLHGNLSPGNNAQAGTVFTLQDTNTRASLLGYLADHRYENFYYFGHGNSSAIGAYNGPVTGITEDQIAFALGNVPLSRTYTGPTYGHLFGFPVTSTLTFGAAIEHVASHPYRFVWIDACETGKANFCEAFGIPAVTATTNFFATAGVESRAFIGFQKETGFDPSNSSSDPNGWPNRSVMMFQFLDAWLSGNYDLNTIVQSAKNTFGGSYGYKMDSSVIIYGASNLKRFTFTRSP
ncbi:MAG TPA: hypothetical protein VGM66_13905 [Candidatus Udaeobacter sp.]